MKRIGVGAVAKMVVAVGATVLMIGAVPACKKDGGGGGGEAAKAENLPFEAVKEAKELFTQRCVSCHGAAGKGDGAAAAALNPKPRAFGDQSWQKSVSDEHIEKIIVQGGQAVGKSVAMPPNPDLAGKPMVVKALRAQVRAFK